MAVCVSTANACKCDMPEIPNITCRKGVIASIALSFMLASDEQGSFGNLDPDYDCAAQNQQQVVRTKQQFGGHGLGSEQPNAATFTGGVQTGATHGHAKPFHVKLI